MAVLANSPCGAAAVLIASLRWYCYSCPCHLAFIYQYRLERIAGSLSYRDGDHYAKEHSCTKQICNYRYNFWPARHFQTPGIGASTVVHDTAAVEDGERHWIREHAGNPCNGDADVREWLVRALWGNGWHYLY